MTKNGEIRVGDTQTGNDQGEGESLTGIDVPLEDKQREVAVGEVKFQTSVDHATPIGLPHSQSPHQSYDKAPVYFEPVGLPQHCRSSPLHQARDSDLIIPQKGIRDSQVAVDGPNNGAGFPECTTTNRLHQNNVGPTYQTVEGKMELKVFARRKGCKQQVAQ